MTKRRDAETGHYISEEESLARDKNTWVEEHDRPRFSVNDKNDLLKDLYKAIERKSFVQGGLTDPFTAVNFEDVKTVFRLAGLDVDSLPVENISDEKK